jgi:hypothetical protein
MIGPVVVILLVIFIFCLGPIIDIVDDIRDWYLYRKERKELRKDTTRPTYRNQHLNYT